MRTRFRYDADLDAVVQVGNYFEERARGPAIIGDGLPGGINGIRNHADGRLYDSKSRYTAAVRAHGGYIVGNDSLDGVKLPDFHHRDNVKADIQRAAWEVSAGRRTHGR